MSTKVFDPDLKYLVGGWVGCRSWYGNRAKLSGETVKPRANRRELARHNRLRHELKLFAGEDLEVFSGLQAPSNVSIADRVLENGHLPQLMQVSVRERRVYSDRWVYYADCHCGNRVILTAEEILERDAAGFGCCKMRCTAPNVRRQLWYLPRVALRLQLLQVRTLFPEALKDLGEAFNSRAMASTLYQKKRLSGSAASGNFWLKGVAEAESLLHDSVTLTATPDEGLFPDGELYLSVGNWPMAINEVCDSYEISLDLFLEKRMMYDDDNQLMDHVLGE